MESIKDGAQALRMGLIGGYVSIAEVVAWADARISEDHGRVVPQLFDLALQGVYGNLADLRAEMLAYLSRASLPNAPA